MKIKLNKAMVFALFLFGFSLSVSTFLQSVAMVLIVAFAFIYGDIRSNLKFALKDPIVKMSLLIYSLFILGYLWSNAEIKDILHMLVKVDIFLIMPVIIAIFYHSEYKISLYYGFALGSILSVVLSLISYLLHLEFFKEIKEGIVGNTVVIRKRALDKIGLWDERVQAADFDLYLRVKKRELEYKDIKPVHICLDTFIHHYIKLTTYSNPPKFVDAENLISIEDKWGDFIKYFPK